MIEQIRSSHGDNYSYVVHDSSSKSAVLVDPVAVDRVQDYLNENDLRADTIVNTHGHGDHTSGNKAFQMEEQAQILAHPEAKQRIGRVDGTVAEGDVITAGSVEAEVIYTPGHTAGSITLKTDRGLITGDALFIAGCGNSRFGGDTRDLFETMRDKFRPLPDNLNLYPGHDYAVRNLKFALDVYPSNKKAEQKLQEVKKEKVDNREPTSTLGDEKTYNPFLIYDDRDLAQNLDLPAQYTNWDVFKALRQRRDRW